MRSLKLQRPAVTIAALAIAVGGLTLPATAFAENGNVSGNNVAAVQHDALINLDANARGTLTIDKRQRTDTNGAADGNGLEDSSVTGDAVEGVKYKIEKLTSFDLTTQKGWEDLAALNGDVAAAKATGVGTAQEKTTPASGKVTFDNLELGAYVVTEVSAPSGYTLSDPFIVTVPMTNPKELNKWNYDPIVYPKNSKIEIKKEVNDSTSYAVGSTIDYTVTSDIPNLAGTQTLDYYAVIDEYDSRMTLKDGTVKVALEDGTVLTEGTDYTLVQVTEAFDQDGEGAKTEKVKRVSAEFTKDGRDKILKARHDGTAKKVVMTLTTTITEQLGDNGVVPNKAIVIPNKPSDGWEPSQKTPTPENPSSDVQSKYGRVKITKVDSTKADKLLDGAVFSVYRCTNNDGTATGKLATNFVTTDKDNKDFKLVDEDSTASGNQPLTVNGQTEFTTASGTVTIDSLQNNDWEKNVAVAPESDWDAYCLVEVKAPEGYELQTKPIAFQITQANATADNKYLLETTVKDVTKNGGFRLPMTGAAGVIFLLTVGGILILGGALLTLVRRNKREA